MGQYEIRDSKKGPPTLLFHTDNGGIIRIHSQYNPEQEATRAVESFNAGRHSLILVSGLGLGYHVMALRKRFPEAAILVVEQSTELKETFVKNAAAREKIYITTEVAEIQETVDTFDLHSFLGAAHYVHRPSWQIEPEFYDTMGQAFQQALSSRISDLLTRVEFESHWIKNIFQNSPNLFRWPGVGGIFGRFSSIPGIIVSAGPSLKNSIPALRELKDRALIVAVDTAWKVLLRHDIHPHIVITLDAQKHSVKHFLGTEAGDTILLADLVASPSVIHHYSGRKLFSTTAKYYESDGNSMREGTPSIEWFERYIPGPGDIQSGGSVATSAFDLMLNLGCEPIILVGQDLAYTGREIHASGTHHNDDWLSRITRLMNLDDINQKVIRKRKIRYVPAWGGRGSVIADFVFDLYRHWFSDSVEKVPVKVLNATEGGAVIEGTVEKTLEALASELPALKTAPSTILTRYFESWNPPSSKPLKEALEAGMSILDSLNNKSDSEIFQTILQESFSPLFIPTVRKARLLWSRVQQDSTTEEAFIGNHIRKSLPTITDFMRNLHTRLP